MCLVLRLVGEVSGRHSDAHDGRHENSVVGLVLPSAPDPFLFL